MKLDEATRIVARAWYDEKKKIEKPKDRLLKILTPLLEGVILLYFLYQLFLFGSKY
jgi:hypothetical protein